jgi:pyruvate dehydrogenase E2 component (dihydrolipoyllysine-residue acetyltransferase)
VAFEIIMPRLSDSMEEGTILEWLVAEGDHVEPGQPLVEIETDKATVIHEADTSGVILALSVGEGAEVRVGASIAVIGEAGEELPRAGAAEASATAPEASAAAPEASATAPEPPPALAAATPAPPPSFAPRGGRPKASPVARRIAADRGVDLALLAGSGPQGRVTRADVERAAAAGGNGQRSATAPMAGLAPGEPAVSAKGEATVHELTRLQRTVARRMAESRATVPDFELRCEVDMGAVVEVREQLREVADPLPSYNDFIVKAVALGLREFPRAYRDGRVETYSRIHVGIAVAADDALVVPAIFDADRMSLGEIARTARALAERVRDGSITPAELTGGTFTLSNLGMYGVDSFSAVINPPQAAILAVGSLKRRAVVDERGELVVRPTILLSLACDHRVLYGADGARFLAGVRGLLERPQSLLL